MSAIELRPYQRECVDAVLKDLATYRSVVAVQPTGAGKTVEALAIAQRMPGPVMALAHRGELLEQTAKRCAAFGFTPELDKAEARASIAASFVLASVQSLQNDRLKRFGPDHFKFIWIDECHHAPADTYWNILNHFPLPASESVRLHGDSGPARWRRVRGDLRKDQL